MMTRCWTPSATRGGWERAVATGALRLRGRVVRFLPPRREPLFARRPLTAAQVYQRAGTATPGS